MSNDVIKPVSDVLMSGQLTQGKQVEKFEEELKKYIGNPYILTLNSATAFVQQYKWNKTSESWTELR